MKSKTCCFTGHRIISADELDMLSGRLNTEINNLIEKGFRYFACGGALGFDMLAAKAVLSIKEHSPDIILVLVLPCRDQARMWSKGDICEYEYIKSRADKIIYTAEKYFAGCMHTRNHHLVDSSSVCICYFNGGRGGTAFTVKYAQECEIDIINVAKNQYP